MTSRHIALPRGCFDAAFSLLTSLGLAVTIDDHRISGTPISISFNGNLRPDQQAAVAALAPHDTGVLAATTAFGKTVVAIRMIAEREVNSLILVHRRQLLDQWIERLAAFSDLPCEAIGVIGAGKRKPGGVVDVALIQSLVRKGEVDDLIGDYGHIVVDECHHLSAVSFELVARRAKARCFLGLSATVTRKDGHHPIIAMQCGPIRHRVDPRAEAAKRPFDHLSGSGKPASFSTAQRTLPPFLFKKFSARLRRPSFGIRSFLTIFCILLTLDDHPLCSPSAKIPLKLLRLPHEIKVHGTFNHKTLLARQILHMLVGDHLCPLPHERLTIDFSERRLTRQNGCSQSKKNCITRV